MKIFSPREETHEESLFLKGNSHLNSLLARPLAHDPPITSHTALFHTRCSDPYQKLESRSR